MTSSCKFLKTSTDNFEDLVDKGLKDDLSYLYINSRSLNKTKSFLEELITSDRIMPDTMCAYETKLNKNSNITILTLNIYNFHFVNPMTNARGVSIYVKHSII